MQESLVSILLATYNQEYLISETIESILNQTYTNWELVIGDDCSSDKTYEIVKSYQERYPDKIKAFRNSENLGITGNCNEILKRCSGKYIAFIGGDDLFLPTKLEKQVGLMELDSNCVLSHHNVEVFQHETNKVIKDWTSYFERKKATKELAFCTAKEIARGNSIYAISVIVRRDAMPHNGFDMRVPIVSDWLLWIDIIASAPVDATVLFIQEILARYRRHDKNISKAQERCSADVLVALSIAEGKYPLLIRDFDVQHSVRRCRIGSLAIRRGDLRLGRYLIRHGLSVRMNLIPFALYSCWYMLSFFPYLMKKVLQRSRY